MTVKAVHNFATGRDTYNRGEVYDINPEQAADWIRAGLMAPVGRVTETAAVDTRAVETAVTRRKKAS